MSRHCNEGTATARVTCAPASARCTDPATKQARQSRHSPRAANQAQSIAPAAGTAGGTAVAAVRARHLRPSMSEACKPIYKASAAKRAQCTAHTLYSTRSGKAGTARARHSGCSSTSASLMPLHERGEQTLLQSRRGEAGVAQSTRHGRRSSGGASLTPLHQRGQHVGIEAAGRRKVRELQRKVTARA